MTIDDVVAEFRIRFDDNVSPYQVAETNIINWLDEAQFESCRRARLLSDSSLTTSIVAGTATYDVPDTTILIRRAKLALDDLPLTFTSSGDMDEDIAGWEAITGTPTNIITDIDTTRFTLYPNPIVNDTLTMTIIREPCSVQNGYLEIPERFHHTLVDWILYRAYQVRDADTEGRAKSMEHYALFEQEFGTRSSAQDEIFNIRQMPYSNSDGYY